MLDSVRHLTHARIAFVLNDSKEAVLATVAKRRFVRADGPDKVTGSGRYTADLTLTGMLHAKFQLRRLTHGRITRLDTSHGRGAARRVRRARPTRTCPTCSTATSSRTAPCSLRTCVRFEGDIVAAVAATHARDRRSGRSTLIEVDYEAAAGRQRPRGRARRGRAARARGLGLLRRHRRHGARRQRRLALDDRQGRRRRRACGRRRRRQERFVADSCARRADRAARDRRAVAGRPRHDLDVDAGAVRGPQRRHANAAAARQQGAHHRAAPRRRLRRQVRLPLRGPRRRARARGRAPGAARVHAPRGVRRARPAPRGHGHRDRERRASRTARSPPAAARLVIDNGAYTADSAFFTQLAAMHVAGPYRMPERARRRAPRLHEPPAVRARCAHPRRRRPAGRSSSTPTSSPNAIGLDPVEFRSCNCVDTGDEGPTRQKYLPIGLQECIADGAEMAGYGQELPEDEAIGVAVGWWPTFGVPSGAYVKLNARRLRRDHHRRAGVRHRLGHDAADAGRRRARHAARGLHARLPGHRRRPVGHGRDRLADARQQRPRRGRLPPGRSPISCAHSPPTQLEAAAADIELAEGAARVKGSPDTQRRDRRARRRRRTAASCCSAPARARRRPAPETDN